MLHRVFSAMTDEILSLKEVLELLLQQPKQNNRMPFGKHQGKTF